MAHEAHFTKVYVGENVMTYAMITTAAEVLQSERKPKRQPRPQQIANSIVRFVRSR